MDRRSYLALTGLAVSSVLAGCGGDDGTADDESMDDNNGDGGPNDDSISNETDDDGATGGDGEPLEVREFIVPDSAQVGEEVEIRGRVSNPAEDLQVYTETVYLGFSDYGEPTEWEEIPVETPVAPGSAVEWSIDPFTPERPAVVFARLGENGEPRVIDVPPERAPYISEAVAVPEGETVEDFESASIEQAPAGSTVGLAFRYWFYSENQRLDAVAQVNIFGSSGDLVGQITEPTRRTVEENGWNLREGTLPVATEGAEPGEYTFELTLIDQKTATESETAFIDIELVGDEESE